jgi:hypothetical protein
MAKGRNKPFGLVVIISSDCLKWILIFTLAVLLIHAKQYALLKLLFNLMKTVGK